MANGWTPERRAKQAALIRTWAPWDKSTGPKTKEGKAAVAQNGVNAWKGHESKSIHHRNPAIRKMHKEAMTDEYIKLLLVAGTKLRIKDITEDLVQAKRLCLSIKRHIKEET